ncbi:phage tail spike protein [Virgibacillus salexigens]|uniref:phage tail spike protein n=1 Tax=Virgibacillus salexigens TaxID=61016 RepID=UPI00190A50E3|nr:phage tail spike protein [Virgibacillus salexigens]
MIHITDGQYGNILDFITAKNIIDNNHRQSLKDNLETFDFTTFADRPFSEHLGKNNRVVIPAEEEGYQEFVIGEAGKTHENSLEAEVFASASYLLLKKAKVMDPQTFSKQTATTLVSHATNGTEWRPGIIEGSGIRTMHIEKHTNPYAFLKRIATEFGLELRFRVETNGNKVTGRYVDLVEQVGQWRGREVELGKDLIGLRRIEKTDNIFTALKGLGPERDDGTRLEVIVEDKEALQRWGRPDPITGELQHLWDTYEPQSSDQEMTKSRLRELTENELEKRVNEVVEYEGDIADLEHVPGMENKKIRFGDTIKIKDTKFNPPLYLEARVHTQDRSIRDKSKKKVTLGDYIEYTEEEVNAIWQSLQDEIRKKIGIDQLREYAEPKKIESDTPPDIKEGENPIWVDTSRNPRVSYVANSGEWMKMTPTTPEEVNAYNKQQVDNKANAAQQAAEAYALAKAELAETEAKAHADGIVDAEEARAIQDAKAKLAEAKQHAEQAIEDIEVGGRNLLGNTDYHKMPEAWDNSKIIIVESNPNHIHAEKVNERVGVVTDRITNIVEGETYIVSFELKGDVTALDYNYLMDSDEGNSSSFPSIRNINPDGEWHYYDLTFTATTSRIGCGVLLATSSGTYFEMRKLQLKKGNKATDWTLAPEDQKAYTDEQADNAKQEAKERAEQALKDAKAFAENANNISKGVIDVGAIPLRTSVTGARLEWDGVNGLVQYNSKGEPVSWIDLAANAHFANAFLSGRIEALEGFFGDNLRLRDGKLEMVREDGAVSISSGMVRNGLTVVGNDPHFMTSGNAETGAFQSFVPGGTTESTSFHIYGATKGSLDGRGISGINMEYYDVRDALGALAFQKYHFIHSARYLVFRFRKYSGSKISVHVMEGSSDDTNDRLYFEILENGTSGVEEFQVDLGVPDFRLRTVTFKIGWTHSWGDRMEFVRFIMERVFLTDFL